MKLHDILFLFGFCGLEYGLYLQSLEKALIIGGIILISLAFVLAVTDARKDISEK